MMNSGIADVCCMRRIGDQGTYVVRLPMDETSADGHKSDTGGGMDDFNHREVQGKNEGQMAPMHAD